MGQKVFCAFILAGEDGYFGTFPAHNSDRAVHIADHLNPGVFKRIDETILNECWDPDENELSPSEPMTRAL
jgi:hypothetical protein